MLVKITRNNIGAGKKARSSYMYTPAYARERVYISGTKRTWDELSFKRLPLMVAGLLSHEQLHLTLEKFSHKASEDLDNFFTGSDDWDKDMHGLGSLNAVMKQYNGYIRDKKKGLVD